jgi:hypothetical protein
MRGRRTALAVAVAVAVAALASAAQPATPKKWYWTEDKTEAAVIAKLKIPSCRVYFPDPANCGANRQPLPGRHPPGFTIGQAQCTGSDELRETFTFARFRCRTQARYARYQATFAIYPTGPTAFRWKILSPY